MIYGTTLCIGDSLFTGARDEYDLSTARLLGRIMSAKFCQDWVGIDEARNGETTASLLRRLYQVVKAYPEAAEVVICVGSNDAKGAGIRHEVFRENYQEIVRILRVLGRTALVCTIPQRGGFGAPDYLNADAIDEYNKAIRECASASGGSVILVEISDVPHNCRPDGIHFDHFGSMWLAVKVMEAIEKNRGR